MLKKTAIICILIIFIEGCKKYPDDEHLHLFTALHRLTNHTWVVKRYESVTSYSYTFSGVIAGQFVTFYKNGESKGGGEMLYADGNGVFHTDPYIFNFYGTWEFIENKKKIKVTHNPNHYTVWKIYQLDRSTLVIANDSIKYYFEKP